jgi:predicted nucleic acid-binding protein
VTAYLIDSSAWIEFLRRTDSQANRQVRRLIQDDEDVCLTEPVIMELLAGAGSMTIDRVEKLVGAFSVLQVDGTRDYHEAARIYRTVRAAGSTPRSQVDCLIAAVAARTDAVLVHHDRDFDKIAELCYLPVMLAG